MASDNLRLVQALVSAGSTDHVPREGHVFHPPVVTVSRRFGSGGHRTATALAEALGVQCYDKEILDGIAESAKVDRYLMEQLDEQVRGSMSDWAYTIITGKSVFSEDYRRHLISLVLAIAKKGGVIIGRGAHLILAENPHAFRVRITASDEACVRQIMERQSLSQKDAQRKLKDVTHGMEDFLGTLYKKKGYLDSDFDLILNSQRFTIDQMVDQILHAMRAAKLLAPVKPVKH